MPYKSDIVTFLLGNIAPQNSPLNTETREANIWLSFLPQQIDLTEPVN